MKTTEHTIIIFDNNLDINGNMYSDECLQSIAEQINSRTIRFGELNAIEFSKEINMKNLSHEVSNAKVENGSIIIDINILDTPQGNIIKELLSNDSHVTFGCRGFGDIDENKNVTNFECIAINAVYDEQSSPDEDC